MLTMCSNPSLSHPGSRRRETSRWATLPAGLFRAIPRPARSRPRRWGSSHEARVTCRCAVAEPPPRSAGSVAVMVIGGPSMTSPGCDDELAVGIDVVDGVGAPSHAVVLGDIAHCEVIEQWRAP